MPRLKKAETADVQLLRRVPDDRLARVAANRADDLALALRFCRPEDVDGRRRMLDRVLREMRRRRP